MAISVKKIYWDPSIKESTDNYNYALWLKWLAKIPGVTLETLDSTTCALKIGTFKTKIRFNVNSNNVYAINEINTYSISIGSSTEKIKNATTDANFSYILTDNLFAVVTSKSGISTSNVPILIMMKDGNNEHLLLRDEYSSTSTQTMTSTNLTIMNTYPLMSALLINGEMYDMNGTYVFPPLGNNTNALITPFMYKTNSPTALLYTNSIKVCGLPEVVKADMGTILTLNGVDYVKLLGPIMYPVQSA